MNMFQANQETKHPRKVMLTQWWENGKPVRESWAAPMPDGSLFQIERKLQPGEAQAKYEQALRDCPK